MDDLDKLLTEDFWTRAYDVGAEFGLKLVAALAVFVIGRWVAKKLAGLIEKGMTKAGTDDPAKVRDALEDIKGFVGTGGIFNMSAADHNGLTKDAFVMVKIENKDWKLISQ